MKVISVDPGYDRIGVAVLEHTNSGEHLIYSTCIKTNKSDALPDRLHMLGVVFEQLLKKHKPEMVAIETLFFNKNIKTAIGVAEARGIIIFLAKEHDCRLAEFGPQEIKIAVTGYGKSDKKAVFNMIKKLIKNIPEKALDDEYDAIAIGITCLAHYRK